MNIKELRQLYPQIKPYAIEINNDAVQQLKKTVPDNHIYRQSIFDWCPSQTWDLVLIKGVLIHIKPDMLPGVHEKLVAAGSRYLLVVEYYNPVPVTIPYRGHTNRLFKRYFAGELMDSYPEMQLLDYGFVYRRDPNFPQDDITWFLMEKREPDDVGNLSH